MVRVLMVIVIEFASQAVTAQTNTSTTRVQDDLPSKRTFGAQLKFSFAPHSDYHTITQFPSFIMAKKTSSHQFAVMVFSATGKRKEEMYGRVYHGGFTFIPEYQFVKKILKRKTFLSPQPGMSLRPQASTVRYFDLNRHQELKDISIGLSFGISPQVQLNFTDRFFGIFSPQLDFFQYTYGRTKVLDNDVPSSQQIVYQDWNAEFFFEVDRIVWQVGFGIWAGARNSATHVSRTYFAKNYALKGSADYTTVRQNGEYRMGGVKPSLIIMGKRNSHELEIDTFGQGKYYSYEFGWDSPTTHNYFYAGLRYHFSWNIFEQVKTFNPMIGVSLLSVYNSENIKLPSQSFTQKYRTLTETVSIVPQLRFAPGNLFFLDLSTPINVAGLKYAVEKLDHSILNKAHSFKQESGFVQLRAGVGLKL